MESPGQIILGINSVGNTDNVFEEVFQMFDPVAGRELTKNDDQVLRVKKWLHARLKMLRFGNGNQVYTTLNAYNEKGLGLQSVSVALKKYGEEVLLDDEWKSPTIGVITPGLMHEDAPVAEVTFAVDRDRCELITALSSDLHMDGKTTGRVERLGVKTALIVSGPAAVRTYMEVQNTDPSKIRDETHSGVYACCFLKKEAVGSW